MKGTPSAKMILLTRRTVFLLALKNVTLIHIPPINVIIPRVTREIGVAKVSKVSAVDAETKVIRATKAARVMMEKEVLKVTLA